jgi:hypothetical protein
VGTRITAFLSTSRIRSAPLWRDSFVFLGVEGVRRHTKVRHTEDPHGSNRDVRDRCDSVCKRQGCLPDYAQICPNLPPVRELTLMTGTHPNRLVHVHEHHPYPSHAHAILSPASPSSSISLFVFVERAGHDVCVECTHTHTRTRAHTHTHTHHTRAPGRLSCGTAVPSKCHSSHLHHAPPPDHFQPGLGSFSRSASPCTSLGRSSARHSPHGSASSPSWYIKASCTAS